MKSPSILARTLCTLFCLSLLAGCKTGEMASEKPSLHPLRLGDNVIPLSQELNLDLDPARDDYTGATVIPLRIAHPADSLRIHAEGIEIKGAVLEQGGQALPLTAGRDTLGLVVFRAKQAFAAGEAVLHIAFHQEYNTQSTSLYKVKSDGRNMLFTQFEAWYARQAFPCFDEPAFKIPWKISVRVPAGLMAVGNYPVAALAEDSGFKRITFETSKPMPSYLVALAVGDFEAVPIQGMSVPGNIITVKGKGRLAALSAEAAPRLLGALEDYFAQPVPYPKMDFIAVPEFSAGAMENPGAITFRENILLLDSSEATSDRRRWLAAILAHEMAHLWFGDLVTMEWWDDLWLNESFASWMGDKVTHKVYPEFRLDAQSVHGRQYAMILDAMHTARAVRGEVLPTDNPNQSFDALAYSKGQELLGMLEAWLGPETFRRGLGAYLGAFAWKNARAADLWENLSRAAGKDVAAIMSGYLDQAGVPLVSVDVQGSTLRLEQKRFLASQSAPRDNRRWKIPMTLRCVVEGRAHEEKLLLEGSLTITPAHGKDGMVCHPNAGEQGYYRWKLSPAALSTLAAFAPSLGERERTALPGNLSALAEAGDLPAAALMESLLPLAADPSPTVLRSLLYVVEDLDVRYIDRGSEAAYAPYVRALLIPALERMGWKARQGEDALVAEMRAQLIQALAELGRDERAGRMADSLARLVLKDSRKVDPALVRTSLVVSAARGGLPLFKTYRNAFETAKTPVQRVDLLAALGAFRDSTAVDSALAYALTDKPRNTEFMKIVNGIGDRREHYDLALDWLIANFESVMKRRSINSAVYLPWNASHSLATWERGKAFFAKQQDRIPGLKKEMDKVEEEVLHREELRKRDGQAVKAYLAGLKS